MARIIVFEDEAPLRALLVHLLEAEGHEVRAEADGLASADAALTGAVDLVITDLMMPGCDGLEVIMNVRRNNPDAAVIAMSGGGRTVTTSLLPVARDMGAVAVLDKPFMPDDFLAAVRKALA